MSHVVTGPHWITGALTTQTLCPGKARLLSGHSPASFPSNLISDQLPSLHLFYPRLHCAEIGIDKVVRMLVVVISKHGVTGSYSAVSAHYRPNLLDGAGRVLLTCPGAHAFVETEVDSPGIFLHDDLPHTGGQAPEHLLYLGS